MENMERNSLSWETVMGNNQSFHPELKEIYLENTQKRDGFSPASLTKILPEEVLEIEKAVAAIDDMVARGIPSYASFVSLLRKMQVLIVEQSPEFFETLPVHLQNALLSAKIDMPTENEVQEKLFPQTNQHESTGALSGGFTFDMLVKNVLDYSDLSRKLAAAYHEYKDEFSRRKRAA